MPRDVGKFEDSIVVEIGDVASLSGVLSGDDVKGPDPAQWGQGAAERVTGQDVDTDPVGYSESPDGDPNTGRVKGPDPAQHPAR